MNTSAPAMTSIARRAGARDRGLVIFAIASFCGTKQTVAGLRTIAPWRVQTTITVLETESEQQLGDGGSGRTGSAGDNQSQRNPAARPVRRQSVQASLAAAQQISGSVLIIVENGDIAALFQFALDLKAAGSGNVCPGLLRQQLPGQKGYGVHDIIHVFAAYA